MIAQPIATAPKDGSLILGFDRNGWHEMWWVTDGADHADYWQDHADSEPEPTHWCPLPVVEPCPHEWIDLRNSLIESGSMCAKCGALKP